MSRRDYIAASTILRTATLTPAQRDSLAARFADYFETDSPRFDRARFLDATGARDWPHRREPVPPSSDTSATHETRS